MSLPLELVDKILLLTDIHTCITYDSLYCVKKLYNDDVPNFLIENNDLRKIKYLYDKKIFIPHSDHLYLAIQENSVDIVEFLLITGVVPETYHFEEAVHSDSMEIIYILLEYPVNPGNAATIAASAGVLDMFEVLINNGCNTNEETFLCAVFSGNLQLVKYIVNNNLYDYREDIVDETIASGFFEIIRYLVEQNFDIGNALYTSLMTSQYDIAVYLINKGSIITQESIDFLIDLDLSVLLMAVGKTGYLFSISDYHRCISSSSLDCAEYIKQVL
jgi:predicted nucleic acid-binding protein